MTNETLIASLKDSGAIRSATVEVAFRAIDRARFVTEELQPLAYADTVLPIGEEQTISQPTVVAFCLEWLQARTGDRVLDVGSGSGWTTALLAYLVGPTGLVIGIERVPALVAFGSKNLSAYAFTHAHIEQAGNELGKSGAAPFDRILVSASTDEVPETLAQQLADNGRMVISVRNAICVVDRTGDQFKVARHEGFVFVPLITEAYAGKN
ncbi:protein-L-isoaspartate O-methyltransferase [Candidatus Kaiserbacteria bacterium RIFCSPLOWO2_02_FULL_54_13]|uniref:Protein-L-isoaspartate O-methyltransferase n=1 Tax=Candidatus Kaiserbacteria bacterium RIFCSPHIGHO2_02_FULL_54_22 TaxID=1798495 RepID=A0A1F6DND0_9BACT|nr:MAG: Protein-L-isoaspartate(D-aspartate) O-methyltransferase [Parcubacteria group bacterium GW2011_GWA1_54_9]KKW42772.1 MAG: Protein-L-isoaspartate(D-aspartate) O-methyltransferase [Parcubacteria group bacterium GW2011_GWB1_55_9]OGG62949.1 MAG: protein-L-isoaspartate O-methyltransferase [Candidatus Kaiserbacteria bacterium RIFCSPHIGHO2_02_FULL_54_22]OGG67999.1 MAG: protein-L-isoaspartate O-methyltransferase [Candidatus Kaiserbacteria bacterium RIFCSPHIGHO2_12_FULL_54_16]OGG83597.1 MAG: prote